MKVKLFSAAVASVCFLFLCSCASVGDKFAMPSDDKLELGKLTSSQATSFFGKPKLTATKLTTLGNFEYLKYNFSRVDISAVSTKQLVLEFKDDKLNGYYYWSSFHDDKTTVNVTNVNAIKMGFGKMTKEEVLQLLGKPYGKALCPSEITNFKDACEKNTEVWGWFMANNVSLWGPQNAGMAEVVVSFNNDGKVSAVDLHTDDSRVK